MGNRGLMIAIIGGDAAGKSTVIEGVYSWLAPIFPLKKVHMGHPPKSWMSIVVLGLIEGATLLGLCPPNWVEHGEETEFPGYAWLIRRVCIAHDRLQAYITARRFALRGDLVLLDRYPWPGLWIDGPQCARMSERFNRTNRFMRWSARLEQGYYSKIGIPDLMIALRLEPDIAVQRKPHENPKTVHARSDVIWNFDWSQSPVRVVDASLPEGEVLSQVKTLIGNILQREDGALIARCSDSCSVGTIEDQEP